MRKPRIRVTTGGVWTGHTAYQLRQMLKGASVAKMGELLTQGKITESELRSYYRGARKTAAGRQQAAEKAGLSVKGEIGMKSSNITTTGALLREIADVNRFLKQGTVTARKESMDKILKTMHGRGLFQNVNQSNFDSFTRFMDWARAAGIFKSYSSESDVIEETIDAVISTGASTAAEFSELFEAVKESGV